MYCSRGKVWAYGKARQGSARDSWGWAGNELFEVGAGREGRDPSEVKRAHRSCRGPEFGSQHSQLAVTLGSVQGNLYPLLASVGICTHIYHKF